MATTTADWIDELKSISVLELSERIKALEEEFGVSATAVAAAAPAAGGGGGDGAAAEEEQTAFDVVLTAAGGSPAGISPLCFFSAICPSCRARPAISAFSVRTRPVMGDATTPTSWP